MTSVGDRPPRDREMPLWEHLRELGERMKKVIIAFIVVFIVMWMPAPEVKDGGILTVLQSFFVTGEYKPLAYWAFYHTIQPMVNELNGTAKIKIALIAGEVWNPLAAVM
ncbi:MAG: hypothetical protein ACK4M3_06195 [Pyrobaculum sp.]